MPDLTGNIINLLFGLLSAGLLAFSRNIYKKMKTYEKILEDQHDVRVEATIDKKLEKVYEKIDELRCYIEEVEGKEEALHTQTIASWGYRISQLCSLYLEQGYMTKGQYIQLVEMYNMYSQIGGNGKIKEIFIKTTESLEVKCLDDR
jgi:hypothetical protein